MITETISPGLLRSANTFSALPTRVDHQPVPARVIKPVKREVYRSGIAAPGNCGFVARSGLNQRRPDVDR